jgi:hypothetical protein
MPFRRLFSLLLLLGFAQTSGLAETAPAVDHPHSVYDALLREHVREGLVDYAALKTDSRLAAYIATLEAIDPAPLPQAERLAYWINAYNAATLRLMADAWPVESILKLNGGKPWDVPVLQPCGVAQKLTLNQIEHDIIRKEFREPRIHFALVCAAVSCPPLRSEAFAAARLSTQLDEQTRAFVRDPARNRYDASAHTLRLSPIFQWYAADFGDAEGMLGFVVKYLAPADREALARSGLAPELVFENYDWAPNAWK